MRRTSLVLASVVAGLGLLELGLRAFVPGLAAGSSARFELDPDLIYRLRSNNVVRWTTPEFTETSHTNSFGMRGGEVGSRRPGESRILAIGDSFTYGHGVQDDEAYPAVLETLLRAQGHEVRVLNAGVPGYSTDQAYTYFVRDGLAHVPDLLLVGVHCSDISDNFESSLYDLRDGRLVRRDARHTRMYQLGSVAGRIPAAVRQSRTFALLLAAVEWHDPEPARPMVGDRESWSYEKIRLEVTDMRARGATLGTTVAVVLMPCKKTLTPNAPDPYGPLGRDLTAAGVAVLDATAELRRVRPDLAPLFFREDPHLNAVGNHELGGVVAAFLAARGLLGGG